MPNIDEAFRIEKLSLNDNVLIAEGVFDPSTGAGYEAPVGSLFLRTGTGEVYVKYGPANIEWRLFSGIDANKAFQSMGEPTGYINRTDSIIDFNEETRTFSIQPLAPATKFSYLIKGKQYDIDVIKTIVIPATTGMYYIYFDSNKNLQYQTSFDVTLLTEKALTTIIYWNQNSSEAPYFADERHGLTMDGQTHMHFHLAFGSRYINGFGLYNITANQQNPTDAASQFAVESGTFRDEDLSHSVYNIGGKVNTYDLEQALNIPAQIPVLYRLGTSGDWNIKSATNFPILESGQDGYVGPNGRPAWNEWTGTTWQLTEVGNNKFFLMHYFATNDVRHPIVGILGINQYQNAPKGRREAENELHKITGLPFAEFVPIASVIYEVANSFTNSTTLSRIVSTSDEQDYVDWRTPGSWPSLATSSGTSIQNVFERFSDGSNTAIADNPTDTFTFVGGTGISVSVDPNTDTLTIINTAPNIPQDTFLNITAPGQNTITADSSTDTLTFASGPKNSIVITTDNSTDTVTIDTTVDLQEIDNIETSVGLNADGTFNPNVYLSSSYIVNPTSVSDAILQLDSAIVAYSSDIILSRNNGNIVQTFNTTPTVLLFETNVRTDNNYTYNNGTVTVNTSGTYQVSFEVSYYSTTSSITTCHTNIVKNGSIVLGSSSYSYHTTTTSGIMTVSGTSYLSLNANDTIQIVGVRFSGSGSLVTLTNSCRLNIKKMR